MKIFNWFQNRKNGGKQNKFVEPSSSSSSYPPQAESKWPHGLLAIGTLGSNPQKEEHAIHDPLSVSSQLSHEAADFTIEEVIRLQKKLSKLLKHTPKSANNDSSKNRDGDLDGVEVGGDAVDGSLSPESTVIILRKARDLISADNRNLIRRKSFSFLLKNMLICRGGFDPSPSLRDPILVSRIEKLLRIILYNNIFPETSASTKLRKYLENKANENATDKETREEQENSSCKWDKTDSEFIVLEI